ncbi:hypothetical protein NDU88_006005 [Pleurodeles waltl]|uniref:Uncharacterized protein n=1 Tax=Pleurodeles waltl TaxID=8319 RepID=A0AAV7NQK9_PLEWA|nr:hypothetical protein NDU88_006005 [Pleurodeles waltl]
MPDPPGERRASSSAAALLAPDGAILKAPGSSPRFPGRFRPFSPVFPGVLLARQPSARGGGSARAPRRQ